MAQLYDVYVVGIFAAHGYVDFTAHTISHCLCNIKKSPDVRLYNALVLLIVQLSKCH